LLLRAILGLRQTTALPRFNMLTPFRRYRHNKTPDQKRQDAAGEKYFIGGTVERLRQTLISLSYFLFLQISWSKFKGKKKYRIGKTYESLPG
jgi:hypothetical protein